jgi:hypothetical protein
MIQAHTFDISYVPTVAPKKIPSSNPKRKSKFKKCPNAPKRFKSAYIFFSTEMMQRIKAEQKGSQDEKQKITDISKKISIAWKKLDPEERVKWNLIAKKDKERFLEEKRNYKGPWQLPVKHGSQQDESRQRAKIPRKASVSSLSESGDDDQKSYISRPFKKGRTDKDHISYSSFQESSVGRKLDRVSQEERDAAHNLVQLHMQSRESVNTNSTPLFSKNDCDDTTVSQLTEQSRNYNMWFKHPEYIPNSNGIQRNGTYYPTSYEYAPHPNIYQQEVLYQMNQAQANNQANGTIQKSIEISTQNRNDNLPHRFNFAHF